MVITTFIDLIRTTVVYRLACMKKSGNRLFRCPDFVIHYISINSIFGDAIDKELCRLSIIYSETEQGIIGLNFYFSNFVTINVINLGDEINIYREIPNNILNEERISFTEVVVK